MGNLYQDVTQNFEKADIEKNKVLCCLAVILPILFFLPLVAAKDSRVGRFYANQGLLLLIVNVIAWVVGLVPLIGGLIAWVLNVLVFLAGLGSLLLLALKGQVTRLPFIGGTELLK